MEKPGEVYPQSRLDYLDGNTGIDRCVFLLHGFIWQLRKRLGHSLVTKLANGTKLKVYPSTAFSAAFYMRWLERKDLLFIRAHTDLAPTFVDVGANIGLFSALLFDKFSHFILIEPAGACMRCASRNMRAQSVDPVRDY